MWWATPVECASAIARLERDAALTPARVVEAFGRLDALRASWIEIEPGDEVREVARPLVSLDERLRAAAGREGFPIVDL